MLRATIFRQYKLRHTLKINDSQFEKRLLPVKRNAYSSLIELQFINDSNNLFIQEWYVAIERRSLYANLKTAVSYKAKS